MVSDQTVRKKRMARILIAEDDESMCRFLESALRRAGHEVTSRRDGLEALSTIQDAPAYDLLLADIVMPGLDGIELSQKAADLCPEMKVMFITGFAAVAMRARQESEPGTKVLSKPFHLRDLTREVETLLAAA
jgi:two-component system cell cycle response regulator CpdR